MVGIINSFRQMHWKPPCYHWDNIQSGFCAEHSQAMAAAGHLYHAPACFLNGCTEAIACCNFNGDLESAKGRLIYGAIAGSEAHREFLLNCPILSYGYAIRDNMIYLTIRGHW